MTRLARWNHNSLPWIEERSGDGERVVEILCAKKATDPTGHYSTGPGAWDVEPGTWSLGLGAWGLGLGAWDLGPWAWDLEPGTWSLGLLG